MSGDLTFFKPQHDAVVQTDDADNNEADSGGSSSGSGGGGDRGVGVADKGHKQTDSTDLPASSDDSVKIAPPILPPPPAHRPASRDNVFNATDDVPIALFPQGSSSTDTVADTTTETGARHGNETLADRVGEDIGSSGGEEGRQEPTCTQMDEEMQQLDNDDNEEEENIDVLSVKPSDLACGYDSSKERLPRFVKNYLEYMYDARHDAWTTTVGLVREEDYGGDGSDGARTHLNHDTPFFYGRTRAHTRARAQGIFRIAGNKFLLNSITKIINKGTGRADLRVYTSCVREQMRACACAS